MATQQNYINFLETIINTNDTEDLHKNVFQIILKTFNAENIYICEKISLPNCMSVLYEYPEKANHSLLKIRFNALPEETSTVLGNIKFWKWNDIKDNSLTQYNINSLIAVEINLTKDKKEFLLLTSHKNDFKLPNEDLLLLAKFKSYFEKRMYELTIYKHNNKDATDLLEQINKLREKENQRTNFISDITHELKTPLASIMGFSKFLVSKQLPESQYKELANQILEAANRLSSLINDFLQINKLESGGWSVNYELCDVRELVKKSVKEFSKLNQKHKIKCNLPNKCPSTKTDPKLVRQVIDNLISNAIKYSPNGSDINISLNTVKDKELAIIIKDNGLGIKNEDLQKIFNRFYRGKSLSKEAIKGTGLGLAICKEIVDALNGKIEVKSEEGKGSEFSVILPI